MSKVDVMRMNGTQIDEVVAGIVRARQADGDLPDTDEASRQLQQAVDAVLQRFFLAAIQQGEAFKTRARHELEQIVRELEGRRDALRLEIERLQLERAATEAGLHEAAQNAMGEIERLRREREAAEASLVEAKRRVEAELAQIRQRAEQEMAQRRAAFEAELAERRRQVEAELAARREELETEVNAIIGAAQARQASLEAMLAVLSRERAVLEETLQPLRSVRTGAPEGADAPWPLASFPPLAPAVAEVVAPQPGVAERPALEKHEPAEGPAPEEPASVPEMAHQGMAMGEDIEGEMASQPEEMPAPDHGEVADQPSALVLTTATINDVPGYATALGLHTTLRRQPGVVDSRVVSFVSGELTLEVTLDGSRPLVDVVSDLPGFTLTLSEQSDGRPRFGFVDVVERA